MEINKVKEESTLSIILPLLGIFAICGILGITCIFGLSFIMVGIYALLEWIHTGLAKDIICTLFIIVLLVYWIIPKGGPFE